jgi:hypothetical protein
LHNGLWSPVFHGYAGTAWYWWWDQLVDPLKLWSHYKGIARFVAAVQAAGKRIGAHHQHPATLTGAEAQVTALLGQGSLLLWLRSDLYDVGALRQAYAERPGLSSGKWTPNWTQIKGAKVQTKLLYDGAVQVRWMDAQTGEWMSPSADVAKVQGGVLELTCPNFERDVAALVTWA